MSPTIFLFKKKSLSRHKTPPLASHQKVDFFIYFFKKCFFFKSNETKQDIFSFAWNSLANFQLQFLKIRTEFVRLARACDGQSSSKVKSQDKMIFFFFFPNKTGKKENSPTLRRPRRHRGVYNNHLPPGWNEVGGYFRVPLRIYLLFLFLFFFKR